LLSTFDEQKQVDAVNEFVSYTNTLIEDSNKNDPLSDFIDGTGGSDSNNDGKTFQFEIQNGKVSTIIEIIGDNANPVFAETFKFVELVGEDVVTGKLTSFGLELTRYTPNDSDENYVRIFEQWTVFSEDVEHNPEMQDVLSYSYADNDNLIVVRPHVNSHGGGGADNFVFREVGHLRVDDFNAADGDRITIDLASGLESKEQLASFITGITFDGGNFTVSFDETASITLVGISPGEIGWEDVSVFS